MRYIFLGAGIIFLILPKLFAFAQACPGSSWENIAPGIAGINACYVWEQDKRIIFIGTGRGIFKRSDAGQSWIRWQMGNNAVNYIYRDPFNENGVFAATVGGLFYSKDSGEHWERLFNREDKKASNCLTVVTCGNNRAYLGTQAGLFVSLDNGKHWNRLNGSLGNMPIKMIRFDAVNKFIFILTAECVYRIDQTGSGVPESVFLRYAQTPSQGIDSNDITEEETEEVDWLIHDILQVWPGGQIYLATAQGIFTSVDLGHSWQRISDFGLLSPNIYSICLLQKQALLAATSSQVPRKTLSEESR